MPAVDVSRETSTDAPPDRGAPGFRYAKWMLAAQAAALVAVQWCPLSTGARGTARTVMTLAFAAAWWRLSRWILKGRVEP